MLDVDVLVIPGIAEFARGGLPAPAQTDDGNPWVDGLCWLYCGQRWTRVLWIGPATVAGMNAPMFACGPCIAELQERVSNASATRPPTSCASPTSPDRSRSPTTTASARFDR